MLKRLYSNIP